MLSDMLRLRSFLLFVLLAIISVRAAKQKTYEHKSKYNQSNSLTNEVNRDRDPEEYMTVCEIIRYHGYPAEQYDVTTEDGYILTIQRVPHGRNGPGESPRKPVIIQHGFLGSSAIWVINTPDKNLAYILAEAGYDVWLSNIRGNNFGRRHVRLSPNSTEFWQFSFDEMAKYDMPAIIDFVLNKTGFNQTHYIGHSMGTTIPLAMLSTKKEYNSKIRTVVALAPVTNLTHIRSAIRYLQPYIKDAAFLLELLGKDELLPNDRLLRILSDTVCTWPTKEMCADLLFVICGFDRAELNETRLPVFTHHTPAGTSVQNLLHYVQLLDAKVFQLYDYGKLGNLKKYGQASPPLYNVSSITSPVALFWSDNDYLADPTDVALLAPNIKNLILKYRVPLAAFSHVDFMWAIDVKKLLYNKVLQVLGKMWKD